jgi:hypothetical protein
LNACVNTTAVSSNGKVWIGYEAVGIIHEYSKGGRIENEINIMGNCNKYMKKILERNLENDKKGKRLISPVITGIVPFDEEIIVARGGIVNLMYRVDSKGELKETYFIPPEFRIDRVCSYVDISKKGEEAFYLRELKYDAGEYSIGIYGRGNR